MAQSRYKFENEQQIRVCDHCLTMCININSNELNQDLRRSFIKGSMIGLNAQEEIKGRLHNYLTQVMYKHVNEITEYIFKYYKVNDIWYKTLKDIIVASLEEIHISSFINSDPSILDPLNINHYIKIKKIPYHDHSLTKLIRGLVVRKNVAQKKMSKNISKARVMAFENSLEYHENESFTSFDTKYIHKEKEFVKNVEEILQKLKPNIIFVEKFVSLAIQDIINNQ